MPIWHRRHLCVGQGVCSVERPNFVLQCGCDCSYYSNEEGPFMKAVIGLLGGSLSSKGVNEGVFPVGKSSLGVETHEWNVRMPGVSKAPSHRRKIKVKPSVHLSNDIMCPLAACLFVARISSATRLVPRKSTVLFVLRRFLTQSDSASRKRFFSNGLFPTGFFWPFFLSSVESILWFLCSS